VQGQAESVSLEAAAVIGSILRTPRNGVAASYLYVCACVTSEHHAIGRSNGGGSDESYYRASHPSFGAYTRVAAAAAATAAVSMRCAAIAMVVKGSGPRK